MARRVPNFNMTIISEVNLIVKSTYFGIMKYGEVMALTPRLDTPELRKFWKFVFQVKKEVEKERPQWAKDQLDRLSHEPQTPHCYE